VTKPELGTKRLCANCDVKFFDLNRSPIMCPKCGAVHQAAPGGPRGRPEAAQAPFRKIEPVVAKTPPVKSLSLEDADAEAQSEERSSGDPPDGKEDVELYSERIDDTSFIEETEDESTDAAEIVGGDVERDEET
jgi:uncharacterized protein (TIGR02300 family)